VRRGLLLSTLAVLFLALPGCAYFNALYNAKRLYAEAERAAGRGEISAAHANFGRSIEKAARSLERSPDGRWSDDALFLVGRAHFHRFENRETVAAMRRLITVTSDAELRAGGHAYRGAALVRLGDAAAGLQDLDEALRRPAGDHAAFARLWRARVRFEQDASAAAWQDLDAAVRDRGLVGRDARLEAAARAVAEGDRHRAAAAWAGLLGDPRGYHLADSLRRIGSRATDAWGADATRALLEPAERSPWPREERARALLLRAELAAAAGDTATAMAEVRDIAERATRAEADAARLVLARLALALAEDVDDLLQVRNQLLPAIAHPEVRRVVEATRTLATLLEQAHAGQPLSLFAAAELARDDLGAHRVARRLFIAYADLLPEAVWAPKALLAAVALSPDEALRTALVARINAQPGNVYVAATRGRAPEAEFVAAEERLADNLGALRERAAAQVQERDVVVGRAIAVIDSIRAAVRADSVLTACGAMLEERGAVGIRADSARAACIRSDAERVAEVLAMDTLQLRPPPPDSLAPGPGIDTLPAP
jgi:hypothetical protein